LPSVDPVTSLCATQKSTAFNPNLAKQGQQEVSKLKLLIYDISFHVSRSACTMIPFFNP